jgi:hypothetical protein
VAGPERDPLIIKGIGYVWAAVVTVAVLVLLNNPNLVH